METRKYYTLEILENGVIQLLIQTAYVKPDGEELTRENKRTCLMPGEFERAEKLLNEYYMNIVNAAWTPQVIELYQRQLLKVSQQENDFSVD